MLLSPIDGGQVPVGHPTEVTQPLLQRLPRRGQDYRELVSAPALSARGAQGFLHRAQLASELGSEPKQGFWEKAFPFLKPLSCSGVGQGPSRF